MQVLQGEKEEEKVEKGEETGDQPTTGSIVFGRVTRVEERMCKVDVLAVGATPLKAVFVGLIQ
jgi:exosome complex RNA-binding protein Csl4